MAKSDAGEPLTAARDAFQRQDWQAAFESFAATARAGGELSADDWFAQADSAWWIGEIDAALGAWEEAHRLYVESVGHCRRRWRRCSSPPIRWSAATPQPGPGG